MKRRKRTYTPKGPCSVSGCWEQAAYVGLCQACYQSMTYHGRKTVGELMKWQQRVIRFTGRARKLIGSRRMRRVA
ncbi:hypothetical protein LCGC14_0427870 [marine sediment metagenome]|uniref:Uncharacterized protein n=1 Tax=marine sediment metagenome TaxID=412755 RepID=A0A0F9T786_9ZZZZ